MIYYITVIDEDGNEYIRNTWDDVAKATEELEVLRLEDPSAGLSYRIDAVPTIEEAKAANALIPPDPRRHIAVNPVVPRHSDFTMTELFGWYDGVKAAERLINCHECGAVVSYDNEMMNKHRAWHNKMLP